MGGIISDMFSSDTNECLKNHPDDLMRKSDCVTSTGTVDLCVGDFHWSCADAPKDNCSQNYTTIGGMGLQCVPNSDTAPTVCNAYNGDANTTEICIPPPIRDCNGNSVSSCRSIGNNSHMCSQSYAPTGSSGYAIQCIPSTNSDACNLWNGADYRSAEICKIPQ